VRLVRWMGRAVPGQRPVVLVVEDESLIRMSATAMVEAAGFEAIAAFDADDAIRDLSTHRG
jgi:DNA-binding response OmpR family regulator